MWGCEKFKWERNYLMEEKVKNGLIEIEILIIKNKS
jgi:hypothetical protein